MERSSPTDRRFGPNADATWKAFRGELTEADRLDLLLREAAVQYPSAFAPRVLFARVHGARGAGRAGMGVRIEGRPRSALAALSS